MTFKSSMVSSHDTRGKKEGKGKLCKYDPSVESSSWNIWGITALFCLCDAEFLC